MPKRIKIPDFLLIMENVWKMQCELGAHEGQEELDPGTLTRWKYVSEKGGWTYIGSIGDSIKATNTYAYMSDEDAAPDDPSVLPENPVLNSLHRIEEKVTRIEDQVGDAWNYTMLSTDGRVLKIGESREEESMLQASLLKRYAGKKNGGPFNFVAYQSGTRKTEQAAHDYLAKSGLKPIYGDEYYPSHEAIELLRDYGSWPLGEFAEKGGYLPRIQEKPPEPEQGSLGI